MTSIDLKKSKLLNRIVALDQQLSAVRNDPDFIALMTGPEKPVLSSGEPCFECGFPSDHLHHVIPRSMGGTKTVPLCSKCHSLVHSHKGLATRSLVKNGLERAKERGVKLGRPKTRDDKAILELRDRGLSYTQIQNELGITRAAVYRTLKAASRLSPVAA